MLTTEEFDQLVEGITEVISDTSALDTVGVLVTMVMRMVETAPDDVRKELCTSIARTFTLMSLSDDDPRH